MISLCNKIICWEQWFYDSFRQPLDLMVFQWFPMVANRWYWNDPSLWSNWKTLCILQNWFSIYFSKQNSWVRLVVVITFQVPLSILNKGECDNCIFKNWRDKSICQMMTFQVPFSVLNIGAHISALTGQLEVQLKWRNENKISSDVSLTLNPLYVQLPNFISQFWSSKGNQVMSILQVDMKMPGGM